ncbi:MAG: asparaginase [Acidobacteria bacterium]|nr:asparaginase [Acidobacteriota bacterium]
MRVLILHTGGTIGMRPREPDHALAPDEFGATVLEHVPELREIADIETRLLFNIDSSDICPVHWTALAQGIAGAVAQCDGIVVTHGTDAMVYTASALSYLLRDLPIPVILTGAQRPLADPRSDGRRNLVGAVDLATRAIPEVGICFDEVLLRGNRATKRSSFAFSAYISPNFPPLAEFGTEVRIVTPPLQPSGPFRVEGGFDERVAAVRLLPGQTAGPLRCLAESGIGAVLVEAFGVGNLPVVDRSVTDALRALTDAGIVVAIGSQSRHGSVDLERYAGGRLARDIGAVGIGDMTIEAAAVKLMYLLGTYREPAEVRARLGLPIAGEVSPRA